GVLSRDPAMRKLLDGIGINYFDDRYHVVHLGQKKVVSSRAPKNVDDIGNDGRHVVALEAVRDQVDLMSALIGISEDPATRVPIPEAQWSVYLTNSTTWRGQDKIFSLALYFMITHMQHWMPAWVKYGVDVEKAFAAAGGGTPSHDTDTKIAPVVANQFLAFG